MSFLLGSGSTDNNTDVPNYTQLPVNTSVSGVPLTIAWGRNKVGGNLFDYFDFKSYQVQNSQGGKGGGGGGKGGQSETNYQTGFLFGLGEGQIGNIVNVYSNGAKTSLANLGLTVFNGSQDQSPWSYLTSKHPTHALSYSYTAYVAASAFQLGSSPNMPNLNFEIDWNHGLPVNPQAFPDCNPADIIMDLLTNPQYAISGLGASYDSFSLLGDYWDYCQAQGLFMSPILDSQDTLQDVLDRWAGSTNSFIFWDGTQIKFVPLGDVDLEANGATYTANTTPIYNLTPDDFIFDQSSAPVTATTVGVSDRPNYVKYEILDRNNNYNTADVVWQDDNLIAQFGRIDSSVATAHDFCLQDIAYLSATLYGKRQAYLRRSFQFTLGQEYILLQPGDIVTIQDPYIAVEPLGVRITEISEDNNLQLKITAEEYSGILGQVYPPGAGGGSGGDTPPPPPTFQEILWIGNGGEYSPPNDGLPHIVPISLSFVYDGGPQQGDMIYLFGVTSAADNGDNGVISPTVTDTAGNTWHLRVNEVYSANDSSEFGITALNIFQFCSWYCVCNSTGPLTVTVDLEVTAGSWPFHQNGTIIQAIGVRGVQNPPLDRSADFPFTLFQLSANGPVDVSMQTTNGSGLSFAVQMDSDANIAGTAASGDPGNWGIPGLLDTSPFFPAFGCIPQNSFTTIVTDTQMFSKGNTGVYLDNITMQNYTHDIYVDDSGWGGQPDGAPQNLNLIVIEAIAGNSNYVNVPPGANPPAYLPIYAEPGNVNPPCIFEPPTQLTGGSAQVWTLVSGGANWGGCDVYLSFDDTTYSKIGTITALTLQGVTLNDLPVSVDPDLTDTLGIDLSEMDGFLPTNATTADATTLRTLCLLGATGGNDWELIAYGDAALGNATNQYDLSYLRRGGYATTISDHAVGTPFTRVDTGNTGAILAYNLQQQYVGTTLYLKYLSFNLFGAQQQQLADVSAYSYTPIGVGFIEQPPSNVNLDTAMNTAVTPAVAVVNLTWIVSPSPTVYNYSIEVSNDGGSTWSGATTVSASATSYFINPAAYSTSYTLRIQAAAGTAISDWVVSNTVTTGADPSTQMAQMVNGDVGNTGPAFMSQSEGLPIFVNS